MRRNLYAIGLLLMVLSLVAHAQPFSSDYAMPRSVVHPVRVGESAFGSGVMVAPNLMLTAGHVAMFLQGKELRVGEQPATVVHVDKERDIALLRVALSCPCAKLADSAPVLDAPVVSVGFPMYNPAKTQIVTEGRAQGVTEFKLSVTTSVGPGSSGGGVFERRNGEWLLVGIMIQAYQDCPTPFLCIIVPAIGWAVDTDTMNRFLADARGRP